MDTVPNATTEPAAPARRKFNSSYEFSGELPYDAFFAERMPLIHAFSLAMHHAIVAARASGTVEGVFRAVECGVYTGNSLAACARMARDAGLDAKFDGLDTFTGLPAPSATDRKFAPEGAVYLERVLFADTSVEAVRKKLARFDVQQMVTLHQGLFAETLPRLEPAKYHFVNIDCDLYEPHLECLEYFYPRMHRGGVIFFDDYHSTEYPMAKLAVDRFLKGKPESLFHLRMGDDGRNRTKAYLVKY